MINVEIKSNLQAIDNLIRRAKNLEEPRKIPVDELFSQDFVGACSSFSSIGELFNASPYRIKSDADLSQVADAEWDAFVREQTSYSTWADMKEAALKEWTRGYLGV